MAMQHNVVPPDDDATSAVMAEPVIWSPSAGRRHREGVNASDIVTAPLPASLVESEIGPLRAGRRRADVDQNGPSPSRAATADGASVAPAAETSGKRAAPDAAKAILLNASDAANYLAARTSQFWTSTQILSHAEIANLAVHDVQSSLAAELKALGNKGLLNRKHKQARADIEARMRELWDVAELLTQAHRNNLVRGD